VANPAARAMDHRCAAVISAVLFAGGALWLRHVIYAEQMDATEQMVRQHLERSIDIEGRLDYYIRPEMGSPY
jgi:hypothetical protein